MPALQMQLKSLEFSLNASTEADDGKKKKKSRETKVYIKKSCQTAG